MAKKDKKPKKKATTAKFSKKKMPKGAVKRVKVDKSKPTRKFRPAYKNVALPDLTVEEILHGAFSEFDALKDEMTEICDNMSGMEHLPKYETAEAAQTELESHSDCPDIPEALAKLVVTGRTEMVSTRKGRPSSRSTRLSNAMAEVEAVCDFLESYAEDVSAKLPDVSDATREAAKEFADELSEHHGFDVDFPGMYG